MGQFQRFNHKSQVLLFAMSALLFAGCSPNKFQAAKIETMTQNKVFGANSQEIIVGVGSDGGPQSPPIYGIGSDSGDSRNQSSNNSNNSNHGNSGGQGSDGGNNMGAGGNYMGAGSDGGGSSGSYPGNNMGAGSDGGGSSSGSNANNSAGSDGGGSSSSGADGGGTIPPALVPSVFKNASEVKADFVCSNALSMQAETNLNSSNSVTVLIRDHNHAPVCTLSNQVKETLLASKKIDVSSCSLKGGRSYVFDIVDSSTSAKLLFGSGMIDIDVDGTALGRVSVLADINTGWGADSLIGAPASLKPANWQIVCDSSFTPLAIDFTPVGEQSLGVQMSDPLQGVMFDLLGRNSVPYAHAKKKISWPQNRNYMFLGLTTKSGKILGIDQLFGDNTYGPDKKFASNGYAALAKHDDNKDGFIDAQDSVYERLVVWSDGNKDAVSTRREIVSLKDMKVKRIDLNFDRGYAEKDQYGNESRYKSVIIMNDGSLRLIFDLWFSLKSID